MKMQRARLLIVDDEEALMTALCKTLDAEGYATTGFTSATAALAQLRERPFDLLLTDLMMPEMDGIALLHSAQAVDPDLAGIVMTGHGTIDSAVQALRGGALDYVLKPFRLGNLLPVLARALETRRLRTENIQLREVVSIYELSRAITRGLSQEEVLRRTVSAAAQQSEAEAVCILVPTADRQHLRMAESWGSTPGCPGDPSASPADPWASPADPWARLSAEPLDLDTRVEQWTVAAREELAAWDGTGPVEKVFAPPFPAGTVGAALPIVAGGSFFGILCFAPKATQRRLTPGHVKALQIIAGTAAAALESASLLGQLRALNQDLEERVQRRTEDLQAANADLEAFSYSVSHDLRAPLRRVDGYCQMFMNEFGGDLSPEGRRILENACDGAAHMSRLIDDLLRLARCSRQPLHTRPVQMPALVRRVAARALEQAQGRDVKLEVGELADCLGDDALLEQVFANLISNALKFSASQPAARVTIGSYERPGEQVYFVRDNGVGFDTRHAQRLFGVFQRLHSQSEFEGTGIGLSIVRRIIRRHGGNTWAESKLGEGATFYFSLPLRASGAAAMIREARS